MCLISLFRLWKQRLEGYPRWRQRQDEDLVLSREGQLKDEVCGLKAEGKWTDRQQLVPSCEPRRNKSHWDYLLEELVCEACSSNRSGSFSLVPVKGCFSPPNYERNLVLQQQLVRISRVPFFVVHWGLGLAAWCLGTMKA